MTLSFNTVGELNQFLNQAGSMYNSATADGRFKIDTSGPSVITFKAYSQFGWTEKSWTFKMLGNAIKYGNKSLKERGRNVINLSASSTPLNTQGAVVARAINAVMSSTFSETLFSVPTNVASSTPSYVPTTGGGYRVPQHTPVYGLSSGGVPPCYQQHVPVGRRRNNFVPESSGAPSVSGGGRHIPVGRGNTGRGAPSVVGGRQQLRRGRRGQGAPSVSGQNQKVPYEKRY